MYAIPAVRCWQKLEGRMTDELPPEGLSGVGVVSMVFVPVIVVEISIEGVIVGVRVSHTFGVGIAYKGALLTTSISVLTKIAPSMLNPPATKIRPSGSRVVV